MPEIENKLDGMGYQVAEPHQSDVGNFIPAVRTGNLVYLSGAGPGLPEGGFLDVGKLGADLYHRAGVRLFPALRCSTCSPTSRVDRRPGQA